MIKKEITLKRLGSRDASAARNSYSRWWNVGFGRAFWAQQDNADGKGPCLAQANCQRLQACTPKRHRNRIGITDIHERRNLMVDKE